MQTEELKMEKGNSKKNRKEKHLLARRYAFSAALLQHRGWRVPRAAALRREWRTALRPLGLRLDLERLCDDRGYLFGQIVRGAQVFAVEPHVAFEIFFQKHLAVR
jgi:hypothetical protein